MKNVAATNGQSVSFAVLFFVVENTRVEIWAGTDMLLNLYSRPPWAKFVHATAVEQARKGRIQNLHTHATKKVPLGKSISAEPVPVVSARPALGAGFPVIDSPRFLWSSNFLGALTHEAVSLVRPGRSLPVRCCGPRSTAVFRASSDYHRRLFSDSRGSRPTNHSGRPMDCVLDLDGQPRGGQVRVADLDDRGRRRRRHRVDYGRGKFVPPDLEPRWQMACVSVGSRRRQNPSVAAQSARRGRAKSSRNPPRT